MASGGPRPGSGRPKGVTQLIKISTLRETFENTLGVPFEQVLAELALKFRNDILNDHNVDIGTRYFINMANRMIQPTPQVIDIQETISDAVERQNRINNLLTRRELSLPVTHITTINAEDSAESGE